MKRIVLSANTSFYLFNFRRSTIRRLIEEGYDVWCLSPFDAYSPKLEDLGAHYLEIEVLQRNKNPLRDLQLALRYRRIFLAIRPEIYLGFTVKPNIYGSLALLGLGTQVINNISGLGHAFIKGGVLGRLVKAMYKLALRASSTVFFQNGDDATLFRQMGLVRDSQVRILPGSGVNLDEFQFCDLPTLLVAKELDLASTESRHHELAFLFVGRLLWEKGISEYLTAAKLVKDKYPNARFYALGPTCSGAEDGITEDKIDTLFANHSVEYLGEARDVRPHIKNSDCVVLPSYREGTSRALLEGAAMGRPIITTDAVGCRQLASNGNGFICKVRDSESLSNSMMKMLESPISALRDMGLNSREMVERQYSEEIVVSSYIAAIEEHSQNAMVRS